MKTEFVIVRETMKRVYWRAKDRTLGHVKGYEAGGRTQTKGHIRKSEE